MTRKTPKEPDWKPVRRGLIYCSPACGGGCTVAQHLRATLAADKLVRQLTHGTGRGWKARVWENLGWHYAAERGTLTVYPTSGVYYCLLSDCVGASGCGALIWTESAAYYKDPVKAVRRQLRVARKALANTTRDMAAAIAAAEGK